MSLSSFRIAETSKRDRLLLLSALACALLTLLGVAGKSLGMERDLKANTRKDGDARAGQGMETHELVRELPFDKFAQEHERAITDQLMKAASPSPG